MNKIKQLINFSFCLFTGILVIPGCSSTGSHLLTIPLPSVDSSSSTNAQVAHGEYLVKLLGCGGCHTSGALLGQPEPDFLFAGSKVGISYSNPEIVANPAVVFPANLTPEPETGIGNWSIQQIIIMIKTGVNSHNSYSLPVMPWPVYANISDADALDIASYLKSLPPVTHQVPANIPRGLSSTAPFVHFKILNSNAINPTLL